jgi:small-conductance mechanosensitive channel
MFGDTSIAFVSNNRLESLGWLLLTIVLVVLASVLLFKILKIILKSFSKRGLFYTEKFKVPALFFVLFAALYVVEPFLRFDIPLQNLFHHSVTIFMIVTVAWILIKGVSLIPTIIMKRYDLASKDNRQARQVFTQFKIIQQIIVLVIIVVAVAAILMTFDKVRQIGISLLASAGVMGIIVGFAAQKSIANVFAGFQIAMTQPFRIDDVVIVEGEFGRIEEITLTYVVLKVWDGRRLILPITYFIEKPFQNLTRTSADIMGTVFLYVDYNIPFDALRSALKEILAETDLWDGKVSNLQVTNATEKSVEVRILVSAEDSSKSWDLRVLIREKMIEFIRKNYPDSLPHSRINVKKYEV